MSACAETSYHIIAVVKRKSAAKHHHPANRLSEQRVGRAAKRGRIARVEHRLVYMPVIQVFGLSEAQKRAFLLADNRIAADAGWDRKKLAQQLPELTVLFEEAGLTIEDTGFEIAEITRS
jgi:hypothetical protein